MLSNARQSDARKKELVAVSSTVYKEQCKRPSRVYWGGLEGLQHALRFPSDGCSEPMARLVEAFMEKLSAENYMQELNMWLSTMEEFYEYIQRCKMKVDAGDFAEDFTAAYKEASLFQKTTIEDAAASYKKNLANIFGEEDKPAVKEAEASGSKK